MHIYSISKILLTRESRERVAGTLGECVSDIEDALRSMAKGDVLVVVKGTTSAEYSGDTRTHSNYRKLPPSRKSW
jgi:hypothetical protein